jgi:hypothetical protein
MCPPTPPRPEKRIRFVRCSLVIFVRQAAVAPSAERDAIVRRGGTVVPAERGVKMNRDARPPALPAPPTVASKDSATNALPMCGSSAAASLPLTAQGITCQSRAQMRWASMTGCGDGHGYAAAGLGAHGDDGH